MSAPKRRQINLTLDEELYAEIAEKAGSVPVSTFTLALVERALRGDIPKQQLELRRPQQVRVDMSPMIEPLSDIYERLVEVHRAIHQHGQYLMLRAPAGNHQAVLMKARDEAMRELAKWQPPQRSGGQR